MSDPLLETDQIKALADDLTDRKSDVAAGLSAARMVLGDRVLSYQPEAGA